MIEKKIDEIKAGHMNNIAFLDIKIPSIISIDTYLYSEYISKNISIFPTLKTLKIKSPCQRHNNSSIKSTKNHISNLNESFQTL